MVKVVYSFLVSYFVRLRTVAVKEVNYLQSCILTTIAL